MTVIAARRRSRLPFLLLALVLLAVAVTLAVLLLTRSAPAEPEVAAPIDPASGDVSAFPAPGTATIARDAQLSFRGVGAAELGTIRVGGSESGEHTGSLLAHGDGQGVSFVPDAPFVAGESVTVATEHAVRGADGGTYTLTVAVPAPRPPLEVPPVHSVRDEDTGELAVEHVLTFASAPELEPPVVEVRGPEAGTVDPTDATSPGLTVLGVKNGFGQKGPMLVDDAGETVWFHPLEGVDARDVKVTTYRGAPVLAWWEGISTTGYGYGEVVIMDDTYTEVARVNMVGYDADPHEVLITEDDTVLLMAYEPVRLDLSGVGGPRDGMVIDNVVQEIEPETGAVLFEWHGVGQVALAETYLGDPEPDDRYDYLHTNAIDVDDDGHLLVSARHTCTVYRLDRRTGSVQWRLGGRESDFDLGEGAAFLKQHDVRRQPDGTVTILDNGGECGHASRDHSRGIVLELDEEAMTAELVREYVHPEKVFAESQANFQVLPDGQVFFGWGSVERFTLMNQAGEVRLDGRIPEDLVVTSYRAQRAEWHGHPATSPSAVVEDGEVRVSWNGATEVRRWRVLDGAGAQVGTAARSGFETVVPLADRAGGRLTVEALGEDSEVLGATTVG